MNWEDVLFKWYKISYVNKKSNGHLNYIYKIEHISSSNKNSFVLYGLQIDDDDHVLKIRITYDGDLQSSVIFYDSNRFYGELKRRIIKKFFDPVIEINA